MRTVGSSQITDRWHREGNQVFFFLKVIHYLYLSGIGAVISSEIEIKSSNREQRKGASIFEPFLPKCRPINPNRNHPTLEDDDFFSSLHSSSFLRPTRKTVVTCSVFFFFFLNLMVAGRHLFYSTNANPYESDKKIPTIVYKKNRFAPEMKIFARFYTGRRRRQGVRYEIRVTSCSD